MASTLSPSAIHRIICLVDKAPRGKKGEKNAIYGASYALPYVNRKWKTICELYRHITPLSYFDSLELRLVLKDDENIGAIFGHGKPLDFRGCPPLLVSEIVEAFMKLQREPTYLDITVTAISGCGITRPLEAWPQIYISHLPCYACTTVEPVDERRSWPQGILVEKFHISSKSFRKRLTLELHCYLQQAREGTEPRRSSYFYKITIRLADETCLARQSLSGAANRSSTTLLLLPDFASEVYGFLDRAHVGSSLLANRDLRGLIGQLKQCLPVHHLKCAFEEQNWGDIDLSDISEYWLFIDHRQRDLFYVDVRYFKVPSDAGAEDDCAMIRHCLSNSHVADLLTPVYDCPFTMKMLASIADRNFSVGRVELCAEAQRLSDYRSMDAVFGGLQMGKLNLSCAEHRFVELVKTTDFFRMPAVQKLRELKLNLIRRWNERKPRGHAKSKSPLWVSGIYLLPNCQHYRVDYRHERHLRSIERKMVQICEEFERGKIADTVEHFRFSRSSRTSTNFAFSRNNLLASEMKVEGTKQWERISNYAWDVYRFRNASTGGYLTACVGQSTYESVLHIVKGQIYPDASFVGD